MRTAAGSILAAVVHQEVHQGLHAIVIRGIEDGAALPPRGHEPRVAQLGQMERQRGRGDTDPLADLTRRSRAPRTPSELRERGRAIEDVFMSATLEAAGRGYATMRPRGA